MKRNPSKMPTCICRTALAAVLFLFLLSPSFAKNITMGWDCNDEPDLEGYTVYRNIGSPGPPYKYSNDFPEGGLANPLYPRVTITGLQEETKYYVAVTAYDTEGNESRYSGDVLRSNCRFSHLNLQLERQLYHCFQFKWRGLFHFDG